MLNIGDELKHGRYRVIGHLGNGDIATVYEVFDRERRVRQAIKEVPASSVPERRQVEHEAHILASLSHASIPHTTDHFSEQGGHFLVMDLVQGDDLETRLLYQQKPFDAGQLVQWAAQLLAVLEYLHTQNPPVLHNDIKPANLKADRQGRITLLDFGLASQQLDGGDTSDIERHVTMEYSSPEQFEPNMPIDARSDIYALGATLYHLITNTLPQPAPYRRTQPLTAPRVLNPACPPALEQMIMRAMALDPEYRFQTAQAFREAIQQISSTTQPETLLEEPISGESISLKKRLSKEPMPERSKRQIWVMLVVGLLFFLGAYGITTLISTDSSSSSVASNPVPSPEVVGSESDPRSTALIAVTSASETDVSPFQEATGIAIDEPTEMPASTPTMAPVPTVPIPPPSIISRSAWGAAPATGSNEEQMPRQISLNHDGQVIGPNEDFPAMIRHIQSYHQNNWHDIAWHYIIDLDGNIYEGHAATDRGDTGYHYDTEGIIAVGMLGNYDVQTPSPQQIESIVSLMAWLCDVYGITPDEIYPHHYFANQSPLTDPPITSPGRNIDMDAIHWAIAERLSER